MILLFINNRIANVNEWNFIFDPSIHMVYFCTYGKNHIWKKRLCFSVHMICREQFPAIYLELSIVTNFKYPQILNTYK